MFYRNLTDSEITQLQRQHCRCGDWSRIKVNDGFVADHILNSSFEGSVRLGVFSGIIESEKGIMKKQGIFNCSIENCEVAGNVCLSGISYLVNYHIEENVVIENVGSLVVIGSTTFGNGIEIVTLNEGGGREVPLFDRLSAQIAYLAVLYRHDKDFTDKLLGLIGRYIKTKRAEYGRIETGSRIRNTPVIRNVAVGAFATVSGACLLEEGTMVSRKEAPVYVGEGVTARNFIVLSGSSVDGSVLIENSFIGQGVKMGKQFSAENCLFFANCEAFHGEACSLFAGPYTVTHHKSTLMIASLFSFFNAGSGTNQSNHMYKLGPVHQGIWERGSKTGSFAYLMLPCRVGAFSVVMGKHYSNFDSSDFPFSYITEEKGRSELTPAMNLFTVGTRRDCEKWPARDRRSDPEKLDLIHYRLFNPYLMGRILGGMDILNELAGKTPKTQDWVNFKGLTIHRLLLITARKYYEIVLKIFVGQEIVRLIEGITPGIPITEIRKILFTKGSEGAGKWCDVCGMFSPAAKIGELIIQVKTGRVRTLDELSGCLSEIYSNYDRYVWEWCAELIKQTTGKETDRLDADDLVRIVTDWKNNAIKLNHMILRDAEKEFDAASRRGYGTDGDDAVRDLDFETVRGTYEGNKFVAGLKKEVGEIEEKAGRILAVLHQLT